MTNCQSCKAPILWAVTSNDRSIPVDPEPVAHGNIELVKSIVRRGDGSRANTVYEAIVHGKSETGGVDLFGAERYVSHFTTCPNADAHRRSR